MNEHGAEILKDWIKELIKHYKKGRDLPGPCDRLHYYTHELRHEDWIWGPISAFLRRTHGLRFCCWLNRHDVAVGAGAPLLGGTRMGWIMEGVLVGDEICVVHGLSMPMIICREVDGEFRFGGVCYVQGYMHGEAFEDDGIEHENVIVR